MPRRKSTPTRSLHPSEFHSSSASESPPFSVDRMNRLFESYADKSSGLIGPEGMENLCRDLLVDSADIRMVILAWLMRAEKKGFISKVEWQRGLTYLGVDSITRLRREVSVVRQKVIVPECFKEFYTFAFQYNLTERHQKTLDINSACELLNVVLKPSFSAEVNLLIEFLKDQKEYGAVTEDQWYSFYLFCNQVSLLDLQTYDPNQSWPIIIDNFVAWIKENEKKV